MNTWLYRIGPVAMACLFLVPLAPLPTDLAVSVAQAQQRSQARGRVDITRYQRDSDSVKSALAALCESIDRAVVEVLADDRQVALGTWVHADGLLVTKASVLEGGLSVRWGDGEPLPARLIDTHDDYDLALLQVDGLEEEVVSVELASDVQPIAGSLLVSAGADGQPLAIGLITVEPRRFQMRAPRRVRTAHLGVRAEPAENGNGLRIAEVVEGSAADDAGLKPGDLLVRFADRPVRANTDLSRLVTRQSPGDEIQLQVERDDQTLDIEAKLGETVTTRVTQDRWGGGPFSDRRFGFPTVVVHDTVIRPEHCGGPVLDTQGRVVGINVARALRVSTYAAPAAEVVRLVEGYLDRVAETNTDKH